MLLVINFLSIYTDGRILFILRYFSLPLFLEEMEIYIFSLPCYIKISKFLKCEELYEKFENWPNRIFGPESVSTRKLIAAEINSGAK